MNIVYKTSESFVEPKVVEIGPTTAYIRKDVSKDENTGVYTYQEAKMPVKEFEQYISELTVQNAVNGAVDSSNISKLIAGQASGDDNQFVIMEAIADLYDAIAMLQLGGAEE